jgi:PAP2 superfamily
MSEHKGYERRSGYAEMRCILKRSRLIVSGDRVDLFSEGVIVRRADIEAFSATWAKFIGDHNAERKQIIRNDNSVPENFEKIGTTIASYSARGFTETTSVLSGGKLHKSLHKGLHKSLHKSLHKAVATPGVAAAPYSTDGLSWPEIEIPWREIDRLYDRRISWADLCIEPPPSIDRLAEELKELHKMQHDLRKPDYAYRRDRIRVEASNDLTAYMLPLGADAGVTAGRTAVMFQIILWLGSMIGQLYKARYNQPRPNVVDSKVCPFIPVPIYSSYPSNHSFQSFLIAEVFSLAVPEHPGAATLFYAAWEVAVNREFAGLHFRSDTLAGKELARLCAPVIFEVLEDHVNGVRTEWLGETEEGGA